MRPSEIENWTLKVIDQLKGGKRIEESRVEVKTLWIDPQVAARIIAGQANAAREEPILWIIGIDEKNSAIVGAKKEELAVWWERVKSEFDGIYPSMADINVPIDDTTVVSLLFETDRAPFVVKNPNHGMEKDKIKFEVPWREGTSTRTAGRGELLRLLVPITHKPEIEVLGGELSCSVDKAKNLQTWSLTKLKLYVEPARGEEINFVFHRCEVSFEIPNLVERTRFQNIQMAPPYTYARTSSPRSMGSYFPTEPDTVTTAHTGSEMIFQGPGRGNLTGDIETTFLDKKYDGTTVIIEATLVYSHEEQPVIIRAELNWKRTEKDDDRLLGKWAS